LESPQILRKYSADAPHVHAEPRKICQSERAILKKMPECGIRTGDKSP